MIIYTVGLREIFCRRNFFDLESPHVSLSFEGGGVFAVGKLGIFCRRISLGGYVVGPLLRLALFGRNPPIKKPPHVSAGA